MLKAGLIADAEYFNRLTIQSLTFDSPELHEFVTSACRIKSEISGSRS